MAIEHVRIRVSTDAVRCELQVTRAAAMPHGGGLRRRARGTAGRNALSFGTGRAAGTAATLDERPEDGR